MPLTCKQELLWDLWKRFDVSKKIEKLEKDKSNSNIIDQNAEDREIS